LELIKQLVWPTGLEGKIDRLLRLVAIAVFRYGLNSGLVGFPALLEYYISVGLVLGWATPYIDWGLALLAGIYPLHHNGAHLSAHVYLFIEDSLLVTELMIVELVHFEVVW